MIQIFPPIGGAASISNIWTDWAYLKRALKLPWRKRKVPSDRAIKTEKEIGVKSDNWFMEMKKLLQCYFPNFFFLRKAVKTQRKKSSIRATSF